MLYPLKFKPMLKERIWGGESLKATTGKKVPSDKKIGESWVVSAIDDSISVVSNGFLKGNDLQELIEVYMGELVGESIYNKFGLDFPILIKLIDACDILSIQVHPNDELALERHNSYGKTEMWYVVASEPGASLYLGFKKGVTRDKYLAAVSNGTLPELLNRVEVKPGDAFLIPAGTVHTIGKGILIAEIQQTSDITYHIDDWGRVDDKGKPRELHTALAVDAIDFENDQNLNITKHISGNSVETLNTCQHFTTNIVSVDGELERDYEHIDSFVIYTATQGSATISCEGCEPEILKAGESALIPAEIHNVKLRGNAKLLEVYIEQA